MSRTRWFVSFSREPEKEKHVELAAVFMTPEEQDFAFFQSHPAAPLESSRPFYSPLLPILGNDVRRTWTDRLEKLGVQTFWLASIPRGEGQAYSQLCRLAKQGVERLLMIKLKFYAEMDLEDLLRFHCQSKKPMTEVHDSQGQLGVSVLDRDVVLTAAQTGESLCLKRDLEPITYPFTGYAKRILSPKERQELVGDALAGACALRPRGKQIQDGVWIGDRVTLANPARLLGPAYVGDGATVRSGAMIGPFASVERDCVVDCGTTLECSTVLPGTYLAPGLLIRNAIVDGGYMEDLRSGTVVDLQQSGLAGRMRAVRKTTATAPEPAIRMAKHAWFPKSTSTEMQNVQL
jgi:carbonic anhydrase/acetyltransferase-like protein (isoleucine patch superfamily)